MERKVLSVLVENNVGVLTRVASLFNQRGFNIDSLTVSATNDPDISRITIVTSGDERILEQIVKQTGKLIETKKVWRLEEDSALLRELLLIKLEANEQHISAFREIAEIYKAKIIDVSPGSMVLELTGEPDKIDAFLEVLSEYSIIEMCRTGITALSRGKN